jgi:hypothetical protein
VASLVLRLSGLFFAVFRIGGLAGVQLGTRRLPRRWRRMLSAPRTAQVTAIRNALTGNRRLDLQVETVPYPYRQGLRPHAGEEQ